MKRFQDEIKTNWIKARVSESEKELIMNYCAIHKCNISELIRASIEEKIERDEPVLFDDDVMIVSIHKA